MSVDKTSIIIPCYWIDQTFVDMTISCLESLEFGWPDEIIVIDDGSPMGRDQIEAYAQKVHADSGHAIQVAATKTNLGYAGAVNLGLQVASIRERDIFIICNNDIEWLPGALEALLKPLKLGYDISTIRQADMDNGYVTEDKITEGNKFGAIWAMTRKAYETLGPLDTRFGKGTFEDLDYRRRALDAGLRIGKNHAGLVEHRGSATFNIIDPEHKLFEENKRKFIDKHGFLE